MRYFKIVIWSLLIIVGVIFVLQNDDLQRPVRLTFNLYILPSVTHKIAPKTALPEEMEGEAAMTEEGAADEAGVSIPVFVLIFLFFFLGIVVASLLSLGERYRLKRVIRVASVRVQQQEKEIKRLRNLPIHQPEETLFGPEQAGEETAGETG